MSGDVLLHNFDLVVLHAADDGYVAILAVRVDQEVVRARFFVAPVVELDESPAGIECAVRDGWIKIGLGVPPDVRHVVAKAIVVIAFDELDALPAFAVIVAVAAREMLAVAGVAVLAVGVDCDTVQSVDNGSDRRNTWFLGAGRPARPE